MLAYHDARFGRAEQTHKVDVDRAMFVNLSSEKHALNHPGSPKQKELVDGVGEIYYVIHNRFFHLHYCIVCYVVKTVGAFPFVTLLSTVQPQVSTPQATFN